MTTFQVQQQVEVKWHDGWRRATVTGIRENDFSVRPGHIRVYIPGPALGTYQLPVDRVRPIAR